MTRRYGRYAVDVPNPDKVLFPDAGLTKTDLVEHYEAVADAMLPHLRDRALVMQRFPDGIAEEGFYQKQVGDHFPDWIGTTRVETADGHQRLCVAANVATLVYLAGQAAVTLHAWLSRRSRPKRPDRLVFDLDPPGDDFGEVRRTALELRELLVELGLVPFAKLTGSKGVHVVVPLDRAEGFDPVRAFARDVAEELASRRPDDLTTEQRKDKRRGRLYLDVGRNAYAQTAVAPYAVRARPGGPVAAPVTWEELERGDVGARSVTMTNVRRRLDRGGDPWRGIGRRARGLAGPRERLERLRGGAA